MQVTASQHVSIFLTAALCGISLGILFDIFRIVRKIRRPTILGISLQDIFYWLTAAVVVFLYIFTFNNGELRWFEFAGVFLAGLLYHLTLSKYTVKMGVWLYAFIKKATLLLIRIILVPVAFIYRLIKKPLFVVVNATGKGAKRCRRMQRGLFSKIMRSFQNFMKIFKKV